MQKEIFLVLSAVIVFVYPDCHISESSLALLGFTTRSFTSGNIHDCFQQCKQEPSCQSLNYHINGSLCELNNRTISQKSSYSVKKRGSTYFENPFKVPLGTSELVPAISCQEINDTSSSPQDGYYWILDERTPKPVKEYCYMIPYEKDNSSCLTLSSGKSTGTNSITVRGTTFEVFCDSGWTLIARFSNNDTKNWMRDDGLWWYDVMTAQGNITSTSVNQDMISPAFWSVSGNEIKITRSDDSSHTALLRTTSNCLRSRTFRAMITSYGNFRNGTVWASDKCLGSCDVVYGGQYSSTDGFSQAKCNNGSIQSSNKIGFWCDCGAGDGSVMMIGGGGKSCARADHGIGITEENESGFVTSVVECDFGDIVNRGSGSCPKSYYALNLWIR